ncbi:Longitudinals lacking protein, isoforms A/B/D/L [Frankliniella fusca]|uniref:Longitudinals lacking protein, isoforms A/B/D/L n=1 Tax=Frankliniella fusca TaxID=407009 RepID=A0AAE1H5X0_9NEOP|nr:Longitudinals lacking protein, isoforms A/B/D/L [Frankliniella fusca]
MEMVTLVCRSGEYQDFWFEVPEGQSESQANTHLDSSSVDHRPGNVPGQFKCHQCGNVYKWKGNLAAHIRVECGKPPQLQCPHCPSRFKHKSHLKRHFAFISRPLRPIPDYFISYFEPLSVYSNPIGLFLGLNYVLCGRPMPGQFPCPQCGKVYRWKRNLSQHCKLECGKEPELQCNLCPRRFKLKRHLKRHVLRCH